MMKDSNIMSKNSKCPMQNYILMECAAKFIRHSKRSNLPCRDRLHMLDLLSKMCIALKKSFSNVSCIVKATQEDLEKHRKTTTKAQQDKINEAYAQYLVSYLFPYLFFIIEVFEIGLKDAILAAYFSFDNGQPKSLQHYSSQYRRNMDTVDSDRDPKSVKYGHCMNLVDEAFLFIADVVNLPCNQGKWQWDISPRDAMKKVTMFFFQAMDMVEQLEKIKDTDFKFNQFSDTPHHVTRMDTWVQSWGKDLEKYAQDKRANTNWNLVPFSTQQILTLPPPKNDEKPNKKSTITTILERTTKKKPAAETATPAAAKRPALAILDDNTTKKPRVASSKAAAALASVVQEDDNDTEDEDEEEEYVEAKPVAIKKKSPTKKKAKKEKKGDMDDPRTSVVQEMKKGERYFWCQFCDAAKHVNKETHEDYGGWDEVRLESPDKNGAIPINQSIPNNSTCRKWPQYRRMKKHMKKCVVIRKIKGYPEREDDYRINEATAEEYFPPLFQNIQKKYNTSQTLLPNGKRNHKFYREQAKMKKEEQMRQQIAQELLRKDKKELQKLAGGRNSAAAKWVDDLDIRAGFGEQPKAII